MTSFTLKNLALALLLGITSCATFEPYPTPTLEGFPIRKTREVPILYTNDEIKPTSPYVIIAPLEVVVPKSKGVAYAYQQMKKEAAKRNIDAVINFEKYIDNIPTTTFGDVILTVSNALDADPYNDDEEYISYRDHIIMRGVGIKYLSSLNYITEQVIKEHLYIEEAKKGASIFYAPNGDLYEEHYTDERLKPLAKRYIYPYSDFSLLHDTRGWLYETFNGKTTIRKQYSSGNWLLKTCRIKYNNEGEIKKISISHGMAGAGEAIKTSSIHYSYNDSGQLVSRKIIDKMGRIHFEKMLYQADGRLRRKDYVIQHADGTEQLLFYTLLNYYELTDLPNWVSIKKN